jgi:hypothetical protein
LRWMHTQHSVHRATAFAALCCLVHVLLGHVLRSDTSHICLQRAGDGCILQLPLTVWDCLCSLWALPVSVSLLCLPAPPLKTWKPGVRKCPLPWKPRKRAKVGLHPKGYSAPVCGGLRYGVTYPPGGS